MTEGAFWLVVFVLAAFGIGFIVVLNMEIRKCS